MDLPGNNRPNRAPTFAVILVTRVPASAHPCMSNYISISTQHETGTAHRSFGWRRQQACHIYPHAWPHSGPGYWTHLTRHSVWLSETDNNPRSLLPLASSCISGFECLLPVGVGVAVGGPRHGDRIRTVK